MNRSTLFSLLCAGLLISSLFFAGCTRDRGDDSKEQTPVPAVAVTKTLGTMAPAGQSTAPASSGKTCAGLGGDTCTAGEDCSGSWLNAQDTFSCCSKTCSGTGAGGAVITIEPFTPMDTPAEQDDITP